MTPAFVRELHAQRIEPYLTPDGEFRVRAPKGALTPVLKDAVREIKPDLIAWLQGDELLCGACCRILADGQPAGQGAAWLNGTLYHIATCLPRPYCYNRETGKIETVAEVAA